jgi:hypothetical protein
METVIFQTPAYRELITSHLEKTIQFLFEKNQEFALACQTKFLHFEPELPKEISDSFGESVLFILTGYTYETALLSEGNFSFEAGFGEENFGSLVTLPLLAIKQIFVGEYPIAINISEPEESTAAESEIDAGSNKSMEALLSNPENKKLLKKKEAQGDS